jgi:hypothetical protein
VCSWTLPLSSSHLHRIVPCCMLETLVPAKPLMVCRHGHGTSMKSSIRCEMHAEHRLSMPRGPESESNGPDCALGIADWLESATKAQTRGCCSSVMAGLIHDFMISNHWSRPSPCMVPAWSPCSGCPESWVVPGPPRHSLSLSPWIASSAF